MITHGDSFQNVSHATLSPRDPSDTTRWTNILAILDGDDIFSLLCKDYEMKIGRFSRYKSALEMNANSYLVCKYSLKPL